jgi:hypothetical protein
MIFDIKMDFMHKARFVAGGHVTEPPTSIKYSSVVARDSIRLAFLIASLNNLDILSANIGNAYLNMFTREIVHTTCGLEFGQESQGKITIIRHALYGFKSSGAAWRSTFASTLQDMGFKASFADPDVLLANDFKLKGTIVLQGNIQRGEACYKNIFIYIDDILVLAENPKDILNVIAKSYQLKDDSIQQPNTYLGAQIKKHALQDSPAKKVWDMSVKKYI